MAFALVRLIGAVVTLAFTFLHERKKEKERRTVMALGPAVLLRDALATQGFYDFGVETEARRRQCWPAARAKYLPRDVDAQLVRALEQAATRERPALVVVSGPAKAGKSRTTREAAAAALLDASLILSGERGVLRGARARGPSEGGPPRTALRAVA